MPRIIAVIGFGLAATACVRVAESVYIRDATAELGFAEPACHSKLGGYILPKSFLNIQIESHAARTNLAKKDFVLSEAKIVIRADSKRVFCLDYLASPFADDLITVSKSTNDAQQSKQLLRSVSSSAVDQTAIIIRTIVRTVFTAISGSLRVGGASNADVVVEPVADLTFDPFDQAVTASINDRVRSFGFCFVLESYTFGPPTRDAVQAYCKNPLGSVSAKSPFAVEYAAYEAAQVPSRATGIYYRPRTSYELSIYAKDDPEGQGPWLLRRALPIQLENISPVIAIGINRAVFTEKQIALAFSQGDLLSVCIYKKSEMLEGVKIPLEIVKSIVALPTQVMQIQYDQITQSKELAVAENGILQSQSKMLTLLTNPSTETPPGESKKPVLPSAPPSDTVQATPGTIERLSRTTTAGQACNGPSSQSASGSKPG